MKAAFCGKKGSGKTFLATSVIELNRHQFVEKLSFADPLRDMLSQIGFNELHFNGELKNTDLPEFGNKSYRQIMQTLGTDWGRNMIDPDIWINCMNNRFNNISKDVWLVVDDVRFENEYDFLKEKGFSIIKVISTTDDYKEDKHISEQLNVEADYQLYNTFDNVVIDNLTNILEDIDNES